MHVNTLAMLEKEMCTLLSTRDRETDVTTRLMINVADSSHHKAHRRFLQQQLLTTGRIVTPTGSSNTDGNSSVSNSSLCNPVV